MRLLESLLLASVVIVAVGAGWYSVGAGVIVFGVGLGAWAIFCATDFGGDE